MKANRRVFLGVLVCLFCLAAALLRAPSAWAQQAAGSITGTVMDASGAAVPNAAVTVRDVDRGTTWTTKTDSSGVFEFPQITVGNVEVTVEAQGFSKQLHPAFTLVLNQVARVDFQMKVGEMSQTVEVSSAPPLLQTDSTDLGTLINAQAATALPLATRDLNQLTLLAPGVVSPNIFAFEAPQNTFGTGRPFVNGAREQDDNFSLDGMDTNQPDNNEVSYVPSPDAVAEFNIITTSAPADFGNYLGGLVVETLKSGTNQYHGDVFEFLRNTVLDANSWQNKVLGDPRNPLQWNEFGGTVGGPIIKNKLFFFADVQTSLYNQPASSVPFASVPAAFRTGDFSSLCTAGFNGAGVCNNLSEQLYDPFSSNNPATRTPYAMNQVPVSSTVAGNIIASSLFPSATTDSYTQHNYVNSYQGDMKIDWQPDEQDHIMGRYSQQYVINNTVNSIQLLPSLTREYPLKNFVLDYDRTISSSLVNEFRIGFQDFPANDQQYTNPISANLPQQFALPGVQDTILPDMNFNGVYTDVGNADLVEIFHDTTIEAEDSLTWTHGRHVVHTGFEYFHYLMNDLYPGNQGLAGSFIFTGQFTGNSPTGTGGGNPFADFILGLPEAVNEGTPLRFHLRNSLIAGFAQDNWHVTDHLSVNIGLRYEATTARGDKDSNNNVNFDQVTGTPEIGTNFNTYWGIGDFEPRIGLAWQPGFAPNTVFRAAYGINTYMEGNGVGNMAVVNPPYVVTRAEVNAGLALPTTTLDQGYSAFPAATCTAAALQAFSPDCLSSATVHETNPNLRPAVDEQWNATAQHQFGRGTTVSAGYVGNKVTHMTDLFLWNQDQIVGGVLQPGPYSQPLVAAGAQVRYNDSSAIETYNALELTATQRDFHGLDLQAGYTWSKCLTNSFGYFGQYGDEEGVGQSQTYGGSFFFQNDYDPLADYGRCFTDVAGALNGYALYQLPFGRGKQFGNGANGALNQVIGGWSAAVDFNIHSGFAIDPSMPFNDQSGTGGGANFADRPNCVPGVSQYGNGQFEEVGAGVYGIQFLNPAAVSLPAPGTFGNCGLGAFRGPSLKTADLNITKAFPINERFNLQFMAQFINLTNTPIWGAPNSSCNPSCNGVITTGTGGNAGSTGAGSFGLIQSLDPGRQIQFALKLNF
ncbi:MAG: TonB-dependent receptor [Candidatus Acidiferrales bacterium]